MWKQHGKETCETGAKHVLNSWKLNLLQEIFFMQIQLNSIRQLIGMKQYGSSPYCILHSSVLQYIVILQYVYDQTLLKIILRECLVHNYTCSMQLINVESQGQALIITFMYQFVILIFNLLKPTQYLAHTYNSTAIYCNILQYIAICNISILSIGHIVLYCSSTAGTSGMASNAGTSGMAGTDGTSGLADTIAV